MAIIEKKDLIGVCRELPEQPKVSGGIVLQSYEYGCQEHTPSINLLSVQVKGEEMSFAAKVDRTEIEGTILDDYGVVDLSLYI